MSSTASLDTRSDQIYSQLPCENPFPNGKRVELTDEKNVRKIEEYAEQFFLKLLKAASEQKAAEMIYQFLDNPNKDLILGHHVVGGLHTYLFPYLEECACINSENFNRFKKLKKNRS